MPHGARRHLRAKLFIGCRLPELHGWHRHCRNHQLRQQSDHRHGTGNDRNQRVGCRIRIFSRLLLHLPTEINQSDAFRRLDERHHHPRRSAKPDHHQSSTPTTRPSPDSISTTNRPIRSTSRLAPPARFCRVIPGVASVYAVCQPASCNPTPINVFGLNGTGLSITSNAVNITTPGTISDLCVVCRARQIAIFCADRIADGNPRINRSAPLCSELDDHGPDWQQSLFWFSA